ncbi:MAG: hypothetical protein KC502_05840 [Myxococcales bacterium]|nr:hypothetical protein [Myxococcales bacterium]
MRRLSHLLPGASWCWHGTMDFTDAVALNEADAVACVSGGTPRVRLFTPDRPTLTLGRRVHDIARAGLEETVRQCQINQIDVIEADRGGQATLHLPGQIVAFVALPCTRTEVAQLVSDLLEGAAKIASQYGVEPDWGTGVDTGLWSGGAKLVSVGLRHTDGVARHGLSFNVAIERELCRSLVLCGHSAVGYADLSSFGSAVELSVVAGQLAAAWGCNGPVPLSFIGPT